MTFFYLCPQVIQERFNKLQNMTRAGGRGGGEMSVNKNKTTIAGAHQENEVLHFAITKVEAFVKRKSLLPCTPGLTAENA